MGWRITLIKLWLDKSNGFQHLPSMYTFRYVPARFFLLLSGIFFKQLRNSTSALYKSSWSKESYLRKHNLPRLRNADHIHFLQLTVRTSQPGKRRQVWQSWRLELYMKYALDNQGHQSSISCWLSWNLLKLTWTQLSWGKRKIQGMHKVGKGGRGDIITEEGGEKEGRF